MKNNTVLNALASAIAARANCAKKLATHRDWFDRHSATIERIEKDYLPSGSGIDCGTKVDLSEPRGMARSNGHSRIVLTLSYHHMNEGGMYDGWTEHTVTVTPDLLFGYTLKISGRDRNDIRDYLNDVLTTALDTEFAAVAPCATEHETA